MDVIVDQRGEQVVRERNGTEIAGEMQINVFHGHYLGIAAAGGAAFHAEHRPQARLAQTNNRLLTDLVERIPETDGGCRLALARGRRAQGRDQYQLAIRFRRKAVDVVQRDLGLVMPVIFKARGGYAETRGNLANGLHGRFLGDLDIGWHKSLLLNTTIIDFNAGLRWSTARLADRAWSPRAPAATRECTRLSRNIHP